MHRQPFIGGACAKAAFSIALVIVGLAIGLQEVWPVLHDQWTRLYGPNEHGYIVLTMGVWIAVTDWRDKPVSDFSPFLPALIPLFACIALLALMEFLFIGLTRLTLLPLIVLLATAAVLGKETGRRLFWGTTFVYFALPQWGVANGVLQNLTVGSVSAMLHATGVAAYIDGSEVRIPAGIFQIASGCSGLNYLMAGTALAAFLALTRLRRWRHRLWLVCVAAIASVLFNWVRVYLVILIGDLTDMQHYLVRVEHHTFGWLLFLVFLAPVIWFSFRLQSQAPMPSVPLPATSERRGGDLTVGGSTVWVAATVMLILLIPQGFVSRDPGMNGASFGPLPIALASAQREPVATTTWAPNFVNADQEIAEYVSDDGTVTVFRAAYRYQDRDHRLIDGRNDFLGQGFRAVESSIRLPDPGSADFEVLEYRGILRGNQRIVWAWYDLGGHPAHTPLGAKLAELIARVSGRRDAAAFGLMAECHPDCEAARDLLREFAITARRELTIVPAD